MDLALGLPKLKSRKQFTSHVPWRQTLREELLQLVPSSILSAMLTTSWGSSEALQWREHGLSQFLWLDHRWYLPSTGWLLNLAHCSSNQSMLGSGQGCSWHTRHTLPAPSQPPELKHILCRHSRPPPQLRLHEDQEDQLAQELGLVDKEPSTKLAWKSNRNSIWKINRNKTNVAQEFRPIWILFCLLRLLCLIFWQNNVFQCSMFYDWHMLTAWTSELVFL